MPKSVPCGTAKQNQEKLLEKIKIHNSKVSMKVQIKFQNYQIAFKPGMNKENQTKTSSGSHLKSNVYHQFVE
jgi:hypothetical protein